MDQRSADLSLAVIAAMRAAGISAEELAQRAGLSMDQLARRLSAQTDFTVPEIRRIAKIVGRKWFDLMDTDTAA